MDAKCAVCIGTEKQTINSIPTGYIYYTCIFRHTALDLITRNNNEK